MLKRPITYEDFNGETHTEDFYFNLTKTELYEMETEIEGGLVETMNKIIEEKNNHQLIKLFQRIILRAYGQKSEDGKRFIKNEQLAEEFSQTAAYDQLFIELGSNADAGAEFIIGIVPKDIGREGEKQMKELEKLSPPPANEQPNQEAPTTNEG